MVLLDVQLTLKSWLDSDTTVKKWNLNNPQLETNETCCCDLCSSEHFFAGRPFFVKSAFLTISKQRNNDQKEVFFVKYVELKYIIFRSSSCRNKLGRS